MIPDYDVVVVDEAHEVVSRVTQAATDELLASDVDRALSERSLLIEFLHESKFGKDKFQDFVHAVGLAAPNSPAAIDRALAAVYGTDLAGLDKQWVEYCKTRK